MTPRPAGLLPLLGCHSPPSQLFFFPRITRLALRHPPHPQPAPLKVSRRYRRAFANSIPDTQTEANRRNASPALRTMVWCMIGPFETSKWKSRLKAELKDIQSLRALFLQETSFQMRFDACHDELHTTRAGARPRLMDTYAHEAGN
jgi:hypothetical protein